MADKDITFTIETDDSINFDFDNQVHDYLTAINKPSINGHVLVGNMSLNDIGLNGLIASNTKLGQVIVNQKGGISIDNNGYISIKGYENFNAEELDIANIIQINNIGELPSIGESHTLYAYFDETKDEMTLYMWDKFNLKYHKVEEAYDVIDGGDVNSKSDVVYNK